MNEPAPSLRPVPLPQRCLAEAARLALKLAGWRVLFNGFPAAKGIAIVYPHTSNWDVVWGMLARWVIAQPVSFVGKESLFKGLTGATVGRFLRAFGGRPIVRSRSTGAVQELADLMDSEPWFWLAIAPEGTRRFRPYWRSGFYHLALARDLPVVLASIDYGRREVAVDRVLRMSGDVEKDLAAIRAYYADKRGRHPENQGLIAFRERDAAEKTGSPLSRG